MLERKHRATAIMYGDEAKSFFKGALKELNNKTPPDERCLLNREIGGFWKEGDAYYGFDNYSQTLNIEEFDCEGEAVKYAIGIMATTTSGIKI